MSAVALHDRGTPVAIPKVGHYATDGTRLAYVLSDDGEGDKRTLLIEDALNPFTDELNLEKVVARKWKLVEREDDDGI